MTEEKKQKRPQQVYTLLVQVGRNDDDGLPKNATGGAMMCFASGVDEAEAVRETVGALLKPSPVHPVRRAQEIPAVLHAGGRPAEADGHFVRGVRAPAARAARPDDWRRRLQPG